MPNPFFDGNKFSNYPSNNKINDIRQAYKIFANSKNPIEVFNNMAQKNPQLQPIVSMLKNGNNPQQVFVDLCQQRGIDPNEFIKQFTGK